jgi:hypothetical protein
MNNWTMIGKSVLYFSQTYNTDAREFPLQPRAAVIVGDQGGGRYTVTVFQDSNRNFNKPAVETFRGVKMCKPGDTGTERHWICETKDMPKGGDWTIPPTIADKPGDMASAAKVAAKVSAPAS